MTLLYDNEGVDNLLSPADQGAGELFHFRNTTGCEGLNQFVQLLGSSIVSAVVIEVHNVILEVPCLFQIGMNGFDHGFNFVIIEEPVQLAVHFPWTAGVEQLSAFFVFGVRPLEYHPVEFLLQIILVSLYMRSGNVFCGLLHFSDPDAVGLS